jgi:hypothetical protein
MHAAAISSDTTVRPGVPGGRILQLRPWILNWARRGFAPAEPEVQAKLDAVVQSFAAGYNHAMSPRPAWNTKAAPESLRGFAVEGAAMAQALGDLLTSSRGRRLRWLAGADGDRHPHLIHVGAGWAFARLRCPPWRGIDFGEPVVRWLAWDGWGFHQAFFAPRRSSAHSGSDGPHGGAGARSGTRAPGGRCGSTLAPTQIASPL